MKQTSSLAVLALVNNISATKIAQLTQSKNVTPEEQEAIFNKAKEEQMISILKRQEMMIAQEELGGDYAPKADPELAAQMQAQKKAYSIAGEMPEISGTVNIWDRTIHLDNGTRTDENGKQLQWPNW